MEPYADNVVTFRVLLAGFEKATHRFHDASLGQDAVAMFHPLFEALNWATALDDQVGAHWAPAGSPLGWEWRRRVPEGRYVQAVRFARNRVHHQWADALNRTDGAVWPLRWPTAWQEWSWRASADLPDGRDERHRDVYDEVLGDQPARYALDELSTAYRQLAERLEPQLAKSQDQ
ncbi:MAG: hypothetical protein WA991_16050 [Ornithinimicrobium sp.]